MLRKNGRALWCQWMPYVFINVEPRQWFTNLPMAKDKSIKVPIQTQLNLLPSWPIWSTKEKSMNYVQFTIKILQCTATPPPPTKKKNYSGLNYQNPGPPMPSTGPYPSPPWLGTAYRRCRRPYPLRCQLCGWDPKKGDSNGKKHGKIQANHWRIEDALQIHKWRVLSGNTIQVFLMGFPASWLVTRFKRDFNVMSTKHMKM